MPLYKEILSSKPDLFSKQARNRLISELARSQVIDGKFARDLCMDLNISMDELMIRLLPLAETHARIPISGFPVGVVVLGKEGPKGEPGNLYFGSNLEFENMPLQFCVHGEQSAINNAFLHGERGIKALAVSAPPCGYCRQFIHEIHDPHSISILVKDEEPGQFQKGSINKFLPGAFGPEDLGIHGGFMAHERQVFSHGNIQDPLLTAAVTAAENSYAPYTGNHAGIAVKTAEGKIFTGCYIENAAYNPGITPAGSLISFMCMNESCGIQEIEDAVFVEKKTRISQFETSAMLLKTITDTRLRKADLAVC